MSIFTTISPTLIQSAAMSTHFAMGTVMSHRVYGNNVKFCLAAAQAEIERLESLLSRFLPFSDISRINQSAGVKSERVSFDTFKVLSQAVDFSRRFPGYFDITIDPLSALWRNSGESFLVPEEAEIHSVLPLVNSHDLILNPWNMTAELRKPGQSIDLGGIGKGYAGDRIREILKQSGQTSAFSNLGGNVVTVGSKPDGSPWQIGIQHPRMENCLIGCVSVVDQCVVTSGDYQRFFIDGQGKRRHHILSVKNGYPTRSGLASVTVIADKSITADALATILFAAGLKEGFDILSVYPGAEAIFVDEDCRVFISGGLKDHFHAQEGVRVNHL